MWYFWLIPLVIFWSFGFRRRWERPHRGRKWRQVEEGSASPELMNEVETQRTYISDLEGRVAELENRLDFAERLISTRHQSESTVT